jgi:hypothetical protein
MNDWNEWKIPKRHASTNMEKLRTTRIMMANVRYVAPGAGHTKSQAAWFLFHRVYIKLPLGFRRLRVYMLTRTRRRDSVIGTAARLRGRQRMLSLSGEWWVRNRKYSIVDWYFRRRFRSFIYTIQFQRADLSSFWMWQGRKQSSPDACIRMIQSVSRALYNGPISLQSCHPLNTWRM